METILPHYLNRIRKNPKAFENAQRNLDCHGT